MKTSLFTTAYASGNVDGSTSVVF